MSYLLFRETFHSRTETLPAPDLTLFPSAVHCTASTSAVWPFNVELHAPDVVHTRTVVSLLPDATLRPSGANATHFTVSVWPRSTDSVTPVAAFHSRTVLSDEPDATDWPLGENARQKMGAGRGETYDVACTTR